MEKTASVKQGNNHQSGTGLSTVRLVVTVVIIVACFSALYPKFFHPIVMRVLGLSQHQKHHHHGHGHGANNHAPSNSKHGRMHGVPEGGMEDDMRRHMRPGPHPGMRAAAEMNKQKQGGSSGRSGVMGMILPVYAFGIIGYLVYTLVKVFGKKDKEEDTQPHSRGMPQSSEVDAGPVRQSPEIVNENKLKGLEDLLDRASNVDPNISADEMRELQKRLEETEKQMSKILNAMQTVSSKVSTVATEAVKTEEQAKNERNSSSDSSPDVSSFEVVDKNKEKSSLDIETVKASTTEEDKQTDQPVDEDKEDKEVKDTEEILEDKKEEEESGVRQRKAQTVSSD